MAKIGTPFKQILRKAFAYCNGIPLSFTDIFCLSLLITSKEGKLSQKTPKSK
jgi:hypothetical protein